MNSRQGAGAGRILLVFALFALAVFALHDARGATDSGFGSFDDEPSHFVTGLMVRDYLADGLPNSPRAYAEDYYVRYPKVGIGQWPPVFYVTQGLWMLVFGTSTPSLIAFMSVLTALLGTCVYACLRTPWGELGAAAFGALTCLLPLVQRLSSSIMTEVPVALFAFLAALQFGTYLTSARWRHVLGFAGFATLAILTKGNALALALFPPLTIALSGRWSVLKRPNLYVGGALVGLVCGPWYWLTLPISSGTWAGGSTPTLDYAGRALSFYPSHLLGAFGIAASVCAAFGTLRRPADPQRRAQWAAAVGLLLAILLFHVAIPSSIESRHLVLAAAPWALLSGLGLAYLVRAERTRHPNLARVAPALLLGAFFVETFDVPPKANQGYRQAVAAITAQPGLENARVLISSDARGEGLLVAAAAHSKRRGARVFLRASKVLASSTWTGLDYREHFASDETTLAFLRDLPVGFVVIDDSAQPHQRFAHMTRLARLIDEHPETWPLVATLDVFRDGEHTPGGLRIYRQVGYETRPHAPLDFASLYNRALPTF